MITHMRAKTYRCQNTAGYNQNTVHEGIKPFKCSVCDVMFANNYIP